MNILPLIFSFLIIFSCIAFTFLREVKSFSLIETTLNGYNRAERAVSNAISSKAYRKIKAEPIGKKEGEKSQTPKEKEYFSYRSLFPAFENSKFNLEPLIKQEGELRIHPLYEPLAEFLRILYRKNLFAKEKKSEKLEYHLIAEMIKKARKLGEVQSLAELYPEDPVLKGIYYKMLKGTNQYDRDRGIPPLGEFLSIRKGGKAVSLSFASPLLLEAFFGLEISSEILKVEREKWENSNKYYFFSKENLESLLMKNPTKAPLLHTFDPYLDYSKQFDKRTQLGGRDKITGIAVEKSF